MTAQGAPIRLLAQVMARLRASAAGRLADVHACRGIPHPHHAWGADQHATAVAIQTRRQTTQAARKDATSEGGEDDELKITRKREHVFVSHLKQKGVRGDRPLLSEDGYRQIFFPTMTMQMLPPSEKVMEEIKATGWTREVAFKVKPHVTKLEIKAYLEAVYSMEVERVSTMNYLGRVVYLPAKKKGEPNIPARFDDYKKAYVIFKPPAGISLETPEPQPSPAQMLETLRRVRRARRTPGSQDYPEDPDAQDPTDYSDSETDTDNNKEIILRRQGKHGPFLPAQDEDAVRAHYPRERRGAYLVARDGVVKIRNPHELLEKHDLAGRALPEVEKFVEKDKK